MVGIFDAVKRGFSIATKSFGLVLILIIFNLIGNLASMPFAVQPGQTPTPQEMASALIFTVIFILISIFVQGGALGLVRDTIKEGKMKLASFASYGAKYYVKLLALGILIILIIGIVALIAALLIAVTHSHSHSYSYRYNSIPLLLYPIRAFAVRSYLRRARSYRVDEEGPCRCEKAVRQGLFADSFIHHPDPYRFRCRAHLRIFSRYDKCRNACNGREDIDGRRDKHNQRLPGHCNDDQFHVILSGFGS